MITPVTMHDAMCNFLEKEVAARYTLKAIDRNGNESFKSPQVVPSGWILPRSIDEENTQEEEFPFIIPRIDKVENVKGARESIVTLEVYFGVYDPGTYDENGMLIDDASGYRDLWNLIETTRQAFFEHLTIDKKYTLAEDFFEAQMIPEQIYPYWEGYCRTKWHVIFPQPKPDPRFF